MNTIEIKLKTLTAIVFGLIIWGINSNFDQLGAFENASRSLEIPISKPENPRLGEANVILNDPAMKKNWGIQQTDAAKAWNVSLGSRQVVVAVVDTGIDMNHPDLKRNLWVNSGESGRDALGRDKATNGLDDDGNGFADDVNGWNFAGDNNKLADNHGHGSHIAGIIGAEGGNGVGISGISPKVSLMILKYYDPKAPGVNNLRNTIRALEYAVKMKAQIINYSGGGLEQSASEKAAIEMARKQGILFVAAAGNEQSNSDLKPYYPADYGLENILSVTAIDQNQNVLASSNYGAKSVDVAAPGIDIYSTLPNGQYGLMTGTSQATAFVSGVAALIFANNPQLSAYQVKKIILSTGDMTDTLYGKTKTRRKINSYRALAMLDSGLGLSGIIAENATRIDENVFAADAAENRPRRLPSGEDGLTSLIDLMKHTK